VAVYPPQTIEEEEARVRERAGKDLDGGKVTPTDEKEAPIDVKEASDFV
jgi:hypothetical protein